MSNLRVCPSNLHPPKSFEGISKDFVDVTLAVHQAELVPDPFASLPGLFPGLFFDGFCGPGHSVARVSCEHSVALAETDLKSQ